MTSTFLFLMMIMTGPSDAIENIPHEFLVGIKAEMRQFAIENQINDSSTIYEYEPWDLHTELRGYWDNYQELKDTPRIEDYGNRFIIRETSLINKCLGFNRRFETVIEEKLLWEQDRASFYVEILKEIKACREMWYSIDTINDINYAGGAAKRKAYQYLKKHISQEDWDNEFYYPPEVPIWRFYEEKR